MSPAAVSLYDWLLFGHIVAAMVWVGGAVMIGALAARVLWTRDVASVDRFLGELGAIGPRLLAPATAAVVGLGVWLVLESAAWDFGQLWVRLALGLLAAAVVIGPAVAGRAAVLARRALARSDSDEALRQFTRWCGGYLLVVALLVAVTWDMVAKPGL